MLHNVEESYRVSLQTVKRGFDSCIINFCFLIFVFEIAWELLSILSHISFSFCLSFLVYEWPSWPDFLIKLTDAYYVWNSCPGKILRSFLWPSITLSENNIPHTIHKEKHIQQCVCGITSTHNQYL